MGQPSTSEYECPYDNKEPLSSIDPHTCLPYSYRLNSPSIDGISTPLSESLSTEREASSIPKENKSEDPSQQTWTYPSPRMFYHALLRKGYDTDPKDIESMLLIHNQLNEGVWEEVLEWETFIQASSLNKHFCPPILKAFRGRPKELSPKARFDHMLFGANKPFDRHDWVIDRCGKKVRYIIDYYEGLPDSAGAPTMNASVRPALDSFSSLYHRMRRFVKEQLNY